MKVVYKIFHKISEEIVVKLVYTMPQKYANKNNFLDKQITDHNEKVWLNTF